MYIDGEQQNVAALYCLCSHVQIMVSDMESEQAREKH